MPKPLPTPSRDLLERLTAALGPGNAFTEPERQAPYLHEWRDRYVGKAALVLRPGSTQEVARVLALCNEAGVGVVPQAGNTGLVGGQIPSPSGNEIVLSVERLSRIRAVDAEGGTMTVEAGLTLAEAQEAADRAGRLFPLSMASEGSCRVGGVLATNAGGTAVLAYGTARSLTLGLEAVLADGRIWDGLTQLKKDNTGYDLRDLFIGSEGTLGVITAAVLKIVPKPAETAVAMVALADLDHLLPLFRLAEDRVGPSLTGFEFMAERAMAFVLKHMPGSRAPFATPAPWSALIEISAGALGEASPLLERLLAEASGKGFLIDAVIASSETQAKDLWKLREAMSEAQKGEGGSIKHDVSVPVSRIPEFITKAAWVVEKVAPGARPVPFGHFGDGNVHYNVSQPAGGDKAAFLAKWDEMQSAVHALVTDLGGSISAEHGIGQMKREALQRAKSPVALEIMRAIKTALDPKGILNPGKVL